MARPMKPLVRGGGFYPSRKWTPLVYAGGYTTANGGGEPEPPPIEKTVTGNPIHILDALAKPAQALSVKLEPIQDLHGYNNPWPAGGGKNKAQFYAEYDRGSSYLTSTPRTYADGILTISGTVDSTNAFFYIQDITSLMATLGTATFSLKILTGSLANLQFRINVEETGQQTERYPFNTTGLTLTYNSSKTYKLLGLISGQATAGDSVNLTTGIQIESGSSKTDWTPYSNICPISGWTGAKVPRTGKNLLNKANVLRNLFIATSQKKIKPIGATGACVYCAIKGGEKYTVSKMASARFTIATTTELPAPNVAINNHVGNNTATSLTIQTTEEDNYIVAFVFLEDADTGKTQQEILDTVQCELGSTATAYEPYQGETYSITFPTSAGTVYGGTLDVTSGVLTVDRAMVDIGTLNWSYLESAPSYPYGLLYATATGKAAGEQNILCSMYPVSTNFFRVDKSCLGNSRNNTVYVIDSSYTAADTFKTAVTGQQLVYELATPTTIQLTPTQVELLLGENNIWSDGEMTLVYLADGNASDEEALNILLGGRYVNNHGEDEPTDREALDILLGNTR